MNNAGIFAGSISVIYNGLHPPIPVPNSYNKVNPKSFYPSFKVHFIYMCL